ncbi:hypothetical protein PYR76_15500 [Acinetobacter soli]|nr:hypothetical protein [Acinetobacter soli]WEH93157.1 hypothetical protein PYR75_08575 [Acinetobacter soli]WEH97647.1 hypothetical protein PYR76_15500 [Acinetobacter soli]
MLRFHEKMCNSERFASLSTRFIGRFVIHLITTVSFFYRDRAVLRRHLFGYSVYILNQIMIIQSHSDQQDSVLMALNLLFISMLKVMM